MTPAKRRPAKPASEGDVPTAPPDTPVPDELVIAPVPLVETTPPMETGEVDPEDRATTQPPERSRAVHPARVWPD